MRNPFTKQFTRKIGLFVFIGLVYFVLIWATAMFSGVPL